MAANAFVPAGISLALVGLLAACQTAPKATPQETAMLDAVTARSVLPASAQERAAIATKDPIARAAFWTREYQNNPAELEAAWQLTESLRTIGSNARAQEVASEALTLHPSDPRLLLSLGKSLLALNAPLEAVDVLERAVIKAPNDWQTFATLGVAQDRLERHVRAQEAYLRALTLSPNEPSVLANLGLSQALNGEAAKAEATLRLAVAQPNADARVRQNLALVVGLQGRFEEAEQIARADLTPEMARRNAAALRAMLAPSGRNWSALRSAQE